MKFTGKMSTFGGPNDKGVSSTEGLALFEAADVDQPFHEKLFLREQPAETTGLARRLDPSQFYVACRWDYAETPKTRLRVSTVKLSANGRELMARPADWGPNADTGRVADLSPAAAEFLGLKTDDVVTVEGPFVGEPPASAPVAPAQSGATFVVGADHWLTGVKRMPIPGGEPLPIRRCVVEHFTNGASASSSVEAMIQRGVSAHFVIDRDGTVLQCRPTNVKCAHAGASHWRDPKTGTLYSGANDFAIGIEFANAGDDAGVMAWARKNVPGFGTIHAVHRNGGKAVDWEIFYPAQVASGLAVTKALVERYNLDDVTGHDCIAPDRKNDPGPAFPMEAIRRACGFSGLPVVYAG